MMGGGRGKLAKITILQILCDRAQERENNNLLNYNIMSVNKVILVGNVGRDPEVRYLDGNGQNGQGTKVATFTLATSERYRDRNNNLQENTEWHNIVAWRQNADVAEKFVHKGTQLYIEGRLRTRSYTDAQGVKKYTTEIQVDTLQLLGRREDGQGAPQQGGYQQSQGGYQPRQQSQPAYQQPAQPAYQQPQPSYQQPAQPAYQQPQSAPAPQPIDISVDEGSDDLPF